MFCGLLRNEKRGIVWAVICVGHRAELHCKVWDSVRQVIYQVKSVFFFFVFFGRTCMPSIIQASADN